MKLYRRSCINEHVEDDDQRFFNSLEEVAGVQLKLPDIDHSHPIDSERSGNIWFVYVEVRRYDVGVRLKSHIL